MQSNVVLFVCTGNIFRSLAAELALKEYLKNFNSNIHVRSAGTCGREQPVKEYVLKALEKHSLDASLHIPRKLTLEILNSASLVIPMAENHQIFLRDNFGYESLLFNQLCFGKNESILDIDDVLTDPERQREEAARHVERVIDYIVDVMPSLNSNIQRLLDPERLNPGHTHFFRLPGRPY